MKIIEPRTRDEVEAYYRLRYEILRKPWNQPPQTTRDEHEDISVHLLMTDDAGNAVATGRLQINSPQEGQIRSMAVASEWQGKGLGRKVMERIESVAAEKKLRRIVLDARKEAVGFYERMGYKVIADSYFLFNAIQHFKMEKILPQVTALTKEARK